MKQEVAITVRRMQAYHIYSEADKWHFSEDISYTLHKSNAEAGASKAALSHTVPDVRNLMSAIAHASIVVAITVGSNLELGVSCLECLL